MSPVYSRIWPWIFAALVVFMVYRRFRRNFGRQLLRPTRMIVRMVILLVLAMVLSRAALRGGVYAAAEAAGAAAGIAYAVHARRRPPFLPSAHVYGHRRLGARARQNRISAGRAVRDRRIPDTG
jgi:membrane associated rhomboid family serine protease